MASRPVRACSASHYISVRSLVGAHRCRRPRCGICRGIAGGRRMAERTPIQSSGRAAPGRVLRTVESRFCAACLRDVLPMKSVALLNETSGPGGAEHMVLMLGEELARRGYDVTPVLPSYLDPWLI